MNEYKIKGQARQERKARAKFRPTGGVSSTIEAQHGAHAGKAMAKAMARVKVSVSKKGGK